MHKSHLSIACSWRVHIPIQGNFFALMVIIIEVACCGSYLWSGLGSVIVQEHQAALSPKAQQGCCTHRARSKERLVLLESSLCSLGLYFGSQSVGRSQADRQIDQLGELVVEMSMGDGGGACGALGRVLHPGLGAGPAECMLARCHGCSTEI